MAKINAIGNATGDLTVDPGAAGDSVVKFEINTASEFTIGVDDDAGDSFKISQGGALGANDTFIMTAAGERTMPLQPAFLFYNSATDANVTGNGTEYTVDFNTQVYDQNSDFAADTFTAPATGCYAFDVSIIIGDFTVADEVFLQGVTSNRTYKGGDISPKDVKTSTGYLGITFSFLADMDATDTCHITVTSNGEAGDTNDVFGGGSPQTFFCGNLVC